MSKTASVDAIDAIAVGLSVLSAEPTLNRLHARARAGLIEKSLNEFGYVIAPKELILQAAGQLTGHGPCDDNLWQRLAEIAQEPKP